ncbi:transglutaminase-like domain-containing protein [Bacteroidota bacterium]
MKKENINILIDLLEDPDEIVYGKIGENLISKGSGLIPVLENHWETSNNELVQIRLEEIIHKIQFNSLKTDFKEWYKSPERNLFEASCLIARHHYPDLSYDIVNEKIENIRHDIWLELNVNLTALEKVKILNHIIFEVNKFSGSSNNLYSPAESFINQVLESKKGSPVLLGILYSELAQRLEIPVFGILLPSNFILAYVDTVYNIEELENEISNPVLFYINSFNKGNVLGRKEIEHFLEQQQIEALEAYFTPSDNRDIAKFLINELLSAYERLNMHDKVNEIRELLFEVFKS